MSKDKKSEQADGSAATGAAMQAADRADAPRWVAYIHLFRAVLPRVVLAGVLGAALVSALLIAAIVPGLRAAVPFFHEKYVARASLMLDLTSTQLAASAAIEDESERTSGMPEVSIPTLERLLKEPQIAHTVLDFIRNFKAGKVAASAPGAAASMIEQMSLDERILAKLSAQDVASLKSLNFKALQTTAVEDILKSIAVEPKIDKKLAFDVVYSPLISVQAEADTAEMARLLANLWAVTFEVFYDQRIARKQLLQNNEYIRAQYEEARAEWVNLQDDLTSASRSISVMRAGAAAPESYALPVLKGLLEQQQTSLDLLNEELLAAEGELVQKERQLTDIRARLSVLTDNNGEWIGRTEIREQDRGDEDREGSLFTNGANPDFDADAAAKMLEEMEINPERLDTYAELFNETLSAKKQFEVTTERVKRFEESSQLEELEQRKADAVARITEYSRSLRRLEIESNSAQESRARIAEQLKEIPQTISLRESLPSEFVYLGGLVKSGDPKNKDREGDPALSLESEILNPSWTIIDREYQTVTSKLASLIPELTETKTALAAAEEEVRIQQRELSRLRLQKSLLTDDEKASKEVYRGIQADYLNLRTRRLQLASEVMSLNLRIERLKERLGVLSDDVEIIYANILGAESEIERLTSQSTIQQTTVERLRERVLSLRAQVSENSQQLSVATFAVTPEQRVWPKRTLLALLGGVFGATFYFMLMLVGFEMRQRTSDA